MAIVVEDGSGIADANSYVSEADLLANLTRLGITLVGTEEVLLQKSMDALAFYSGQFKGTRIDNGQPLDWPRSGVTIDNWPWSNTEIPRQLIAAQQAACIEINENKDPLNPEIVQQANMKKVDGAVTKTMFENKSASKVGADRPFKVHINLLTKRRGLFAVKV